jgi:hypothetical protein
VVARDVKIVTFHAWEARAEIVEGKRVAKWSGKVKEEPGEEDGADDAFAALSAGGVSSAKNDVEDRGDGEDEEEVTVLGEIVGSVQGHRATGGAKGRGVFTMNANGAGKFLQMGVWLWERGSPNRVSAVMADREVVAVFGKCGFEVVGGKLVEKDDEIAGAFWGVGYGETSQTLRVWGGALFGSRKFGHR